MTESVSATAMEIARNARKASANLVQLDASKRTDLLSAFAAQLEQQRDAIARANEKDCSLAAQDVKQKRMSAALYSRLKLDQDKLAGVVAGIKQVAALPDLLGTIEFARELDDGLNLYRKRCPIGVVLVIFESRPDAFPQIASLLIKSGNAGLIKGGKEAKYSNEAIYACLENARKLCGFPDGAYQYIPDRSQASELLKSDKLIDLVIPRGSQELVRQIQQSTHIPVLGHAEGICHLYVDCDANLDMAVKLAIDAKTNYPAACNSIETVLIHKSVADKFLPLLESAFIAAGVEMHMNPANWATEYSDLAVSLRTVASIEEAVGHINEFGSGHTDCIVTRDRNAFELFAAQVNSAGVYWNASTRFADGFRYGFGAEVGISTGKLHPRGPVGVDGITTYKYVLIGQGQVVANYSGDNARNFTHKDLPTDVEK